MNYIYPNKLDLQNTVLSVTSTLESRNRSWSDLPWKEYESKINQIQLNIFNAMKANDIATVRNWQNYLLNCYEAKLICVRQITQINKGKKTAGVDNYLALDDGQRFYLANCLTIDGNTSLVRRTYIPKPGTPDLRPLGIPTIIDRCKQQLVKLAIEPEWESKFEFMSYGFRPSRKAADAVSRIKAHILFNGQCWVLDADIAKCFDTINQTYLMQKFQDALPIIKVQVEVWLKAGILEPEGFIDQPKSGTPQGGPISPLLCNIALDGIQGALFNDLKGKFGYDIAKNTLYIRYADDLVFLGPDEQVVNYAKFCIQYYLSQIGLKFSDKKTRIIQNIDLSKPDKPISYLFDFLGFTFKTRLMGRNHANKMKFNSLPGNIYSTYRNRLRTTVIPSVKRVQRHKASIKALLKRIPSADILCKEINPRIIGWVNYFKFSDGKIEDLPRKMDMWMNAILRKWIRKSTKQRGKVETFWKKDTNDWIFEYKSKEGVTYTISKYSKYRWNIVQYKPIQFGINPYVLNLNQSKGDE